MTSIPTQLNVLSRYDIIRDTCRKTKKQAPNLTPYINSLSQYSSQLNTYIQIYTNLRL
jgi:hypothetical protein